MASLYNHQQQLTTESTLVELETSHKVHNDNINDLNLFYNKDPEKIGPDSNSVHLPAHLGSNTFYHDEQAADNKSENREKVEETKEELYGWIVVCVAFLIQMCTVGVAASWGVFQDYYEQHVFGSTPGVIFFLSLVGSTTNFFMSIMAVPAQVLLSRIGGIGVILVAAVLCTTGLELASLSTKIWHLLLVMGVLYGSGCSLLFYVSMSTLPQWFEKRQGLALGIVSSGSPVGGLLFPLIITSLNHSVGIQWCCRVIGLISIVIFLVACTFFKDKNPGPLEKKKITDIVDFSVLRNKNLLLWCLANNLMEAGYYVPSFFLPSYATSLGLSDSQGSLLVSMLSASNAVGRILAGLLGDKIGYINTTILSCIICSISCFFMWTYSFDFPMLMGFSAICGLTVGVFMSLAPAITRIVERRRFDSAYSLFLILTMFSMFAPNLAVGIKTASHSSSFFTYKIFTGVAYFSGALALVGLKLRLTGGRLFACL